MLGDMCINLSCFNAAMPQQILDNPNIGTGFEQVGSAPYPLPSREKTK